MRSPRAMQTSLCLSRTPSCPWPYLRPPALSQTLILLSSARHRHSHRHRHVRHSHGVASPRAYLESPNPLLDFLNKVRGSLPIIGLLSRILSDVGGVGNDRIQLIEFCTRVYKNISPEASMAFYEFEARHGRVATPQYVLIWCWAAALGAGLLKSEDLMLGASRLRVSFDISYEQENFNGLMNEAAERRRLSKSPTPFVPYEACAAKALDAICLCCIGRPNIDEEDRKLLTIMLQSVFPAADKAEIERLVSDKVLGVVEDSSSPGNMQVIESSQAIKLVSRIDSEIVKSEGEPTKEEEQGVQDVEQQEQKKSFV